MGQSLSVDVGYGLVLPWGEDSEPDFTGEFYDEFIEYDKDDLNHEWGSIDDYDAGRELEKRFPLLTVEASGFNDYSGDSALLVKSSITGAYGAHPAPFHITAISAEEDSQLREAAELLGLDYTPTWLVVPSFG